MEKKMKKTTKDILLCKVLPAIFVVGVILYFGLVGVRMYKSSSYAEEVAAKTATVQKYFQCGDYEPHYVCISKKALSDPEGYSRVKADVMSAVQVHQDKGAEADFLGDETWDSDFTHLCITAEMMDLVQEFSPMDEDQFSSFVRSGSERRRLFEETAARFHGCRLNHF